MTFRVMGLPGLAEAPPPFSVFVPQPASPSVRRRIAARQLATAVGVDRDDFRWRCLIGLSLAS
jgi:hypothetical protein